LKKYNNRRRLLLQNIPVDSIVEEKTSPSGAEAFILSPREPSQCYFGLPFVLIYYILSCSLLRTYSSQKVEITSALVKMKQKPLAAAVEMLPIDRKTLIL
jgi:hypothetical protein